jgi:mRNA interferase HigB
MVIISKAILVEFGIKHADAIDPLNKWYEETKKADWKNFPKVKLILCLREPVSRAYSN